jgi:hypothetical protein
MTREEAARALENAMNQPPKDTTTTSGEMTLLDHATIIAIAALRENPCDNCVGPGLAIAHGYKDMRTKKPEVEE